MSLDGVRVALTASRAAVSFLLEDGAVAGSAATADELSRLGRPAHTVARSGSLGVLDAAQAAWKR